MVRDGEVQHPKVVVIGAGSLFFGRQAIWQMVASPHLNQGTLALVDTDAERLVKMARLAELVIADNGVGMDQETREKAFSLFFSSKGAGGTGLGLFIAHRIAQSHGGSITLTSTEGEGSQFLVELPRRRPESVPSETEPAAE